MRFCVCKLCNKTDLVHLQYIAKQHNISPRDVVAFFDRRIRWFGLMNEFGTIINSDKNTKFIPCDYVGMRPLSLYPQFFKFYKYWFNIKDNETETINFYDAIFHFREIPLSLLPSRMGSVYELLSGDYTETLPTRYVVTDNLWYMVDKEQIIPYIRFPHEAVPKRGYAITSNMILDYIGDSKRIVYQLIFAMKRVGMCLIRYITKFWEGQVNSSSLEHIQWGMNI